MGFGPAKIRYKRTDAGDIPKAEPKEQCDIANTMFEMNAKLAKAAKH
jgi:hypothetical protein